MMPCSRQQQPGRPSGAVAPVLVSTVSRNLDAPERLVPRSICYEVRAAFPGQVLVDVEPTHAEESGDGRFADEVFLAFRNLPPMLPLRHSSTLDIFPYAVFA